MKSPLRSSSLFGYRPSDYLGGSRIENIYHLCSNSHVCTRVFAFAWVGNAVSSGESAFLGDVFLQDLSVTSSHLFFLFSYSFLCVVLEEGPDFFHSQCKTVQRTESALCEPHILVSLHLQRSFGRECGWRSAGFGTLKSCVSSQICTGRGREVHTCLMDCFRLFKYWIWIKLVIKQVDMFIYVADQRYLKPESSAAATDIVRQTVLFVLFLENSAKLFGKETLQK